MRSRILFSAQRDQPRPALCLDDVKRGECFRFVAGGGEIQFPSYRKLTHTTVINMEDGRLCRSMRRSLDPVVWA